MMAKMVVQPPKHIRMFRVFRVAIRLRTAPQGSVLVTRGRRWREPKKKCTQAEQRMFEIAHPKNLMVRQEVNQ